MEGIGDRSWTREILNRLFQLAVMTAMLGGGSAHSAVGHDTAALGYRHVAAMLSVGVHSIRPAIALVVATVIAAYAAGRLARVMNDDPAIH
jgi:hypothetical protein